MNILYLITRWEVGTAYKNIQLMKENFGGTIVKNSISQTIQYLKTKPDFMVVRGDARRDYELALRFKLPYILIENDIFSMRNGHSEDKDKHKIEKASAIIFTSDGHVQYCKEKGYKLPYYEIIHSRPLKKDLGFEPLPKLEGLNLVYAGGIGNSWNSRKTPYGYRAYHEIFKKFIEAGWKVHIYPAIYKNLSEYRDIGCIVHNTIKAENILKELSQYTAGFHGYNKIDVPENAYNYTQNCIGNKCWDYLGAGIPTVGFQGGKGMNIYRNKWGVVLRSLSNRTLSNLPKRLEKLNITDEMRYENVMDNDLDKYENVVNKALKDRKKIELLPKVKIPVWDKNDMVIQVTNKRPTPIERGNKIFEPYSTTEPFTVTKSQWKEIKAHVGLKILYIQEGL
jgi:hypothetical protein